MKIINRNSNRFGGVKNYNHGIKFNDEKVRKCNQEVFDHLKQGQLNFFSNCIFSIDSLTTLIENATEGGMHLKFSLFKVVDKEDNHQIKSILVASVVKKAGPVKNTIISDLLLPISVDQALSYEIIFKQLSQKKSTTGDTQDIQNFKSSVQTVWPDSNLISETLNKGYDSMEASGTYYWGMDSTFIGTARLNLIEIFFELDEFKKHLEKAYHLGTDILAAFPYLLNLKADNNFSKEGTIVSYFFAPVKGNELYFFEADDDRYFLASECSYPRPWRYPSNCNIQRLTPF